MFGISKKNIALAGAAFAILCASAGSSILKDSNSLDMQINDVSVPSYTAEYTEESVPHTTAAYSERVHDTAHGTSNSITVLISSAEKYQAGTEYSGAKDLIGTEIEAADIIDAPEENVYVSTSGKYHARSDCSGMKYYTEMSLDAALTAGHSPCGKCYDTIQPEVAETLPMENADISDITEDIVYVSSSGKYHTKSNCSGMKHYTEMSLSEAIAAEYDGCQKCASTLD